MRNYDVILFDLDGTLTDSAPGILNSVRYACRKLGLPIPGEETLRRFLGPPLIASFRELMGLDAADADRAVSAFREYFPTKGLFENEVYPGVPALLADLKAAGKTVILATSKPEAFARRIMEHFDLAQYCDFICGATLDETRTDKAEVIAYALETAGITDKTGLVMVGDREHDVLGDKKNGMPCIGATFPSCPYLFLSIAMSQPRCLTPLGPLLWLTRWTSCTSCCWDKSKGRQPALPPGFYWSRSL